MKLINAQEGFLAAPTREERVHEAAKLFGAGKSGSDPVAQAKLLEAFTTSDFTDLLSTAFTDQALAAQKAAEPEFEHILFDVTVDDFEEHRLVDLWSDDAFEEVAEGEEYKAGTLRYFDDIRHRARKNGKVYGLTWELRRARRFSELANFPRLLGNGSVNGQNRKVAELLVDDQGAWNEDVFGNTIATAALTPDSLQTAIQEIAARTNHRGDLVDTSNLVLVHSPALRPVVQLLLNADELEITDATGNKTVKRRISNPYRNLVTPLESRTLGARLGSPTGWALVQGNGSDLPSVIRTKLSGAEAVDIRVKRDQGTRVGGGEVPVDEGSFNDDTIWFRGRDVWGIDPAVTTGTWASTGAA